MNERERKVKNSSSFYTEQYLGIDSMLVEYGYRTIKPFFKGSLCLELGPANGYMTKNLVDDFTTLHLIEASKELIDQIPDYQNAIKHCSMLEDFDTEIKFDTIIMSHVLEHIENPVSVLKKIKSWLSDDGIFIVTVPNAYSIHRMVAVKMGVLESETTLNERDHELGHYRVYDMKALTGHILEVGFKIIEKGGYFLKPLTNSQIDNHWTKQMIDAFYETGKEFQENCAEIFVIATN